MDVIFRISIGLSLIGMSVFFLVKLIRDVFFKSDSKTKNTTSKNKIENTQVRFGSKSNTILKTNKVLKYDNVLEMSNIGKYSKPILKKKSTQSTTSKLHVKTFNEFCNDSTHFQSSNDRLQLYIGPGETLYYDLYREEFFFNNKSCGVMKYVMGLKLLGKSRLDSHPIILVKLAGVQNCITIKLNTNDNRISLVKSIEAHFKDKISISDNPQPSNIDDMWESTTINKTINSKFI